MNSSDVTLRSLTYHDLSISDPYLENSLPAPMEIHNLHPPASLGQQGPAAWANLLLQRPFSFCLRLQLVALEISIGTRHAFGATL